MEDNRTSGPVTRSQTAAMVPVYKNFRLDEIKNQRLVGSGSFGTVHCGLHKDYGEVAMKLFIPKDEHELAELNEVYRNVQLSAHPNIVSVFGRIFQDNNEQQLCGFVMEFLPFSMSKVINGSQIYTIGKAKEWFGQIARGLNHLHANNIIHRDVKPDNILLSANLEIVRLCDFGLTSPVRTRMTAGRGTLDYMSPEMLADERTTSYTVASDIYSMAITMWETIHRREPYAGKNIHQAVILIRDENLRPEIDTGIAPVALNRIIERCWDKDPNQRYIAAKLNTELNKINTKLTIELKAPGLSTTSTSTPTKKTTTPRTKKATTPSVTSVPTANPTENDNSISPKTKTQTKSTTSPVSRAKTATTSKTTPSSQSLSTEKTPVKIPKGTTYLEQMQKMKLKDEQSARKTTKK